MWGEERRDGQARGACWGGSGVTVKRGACEGGERGNRGVHTLALSCSMTRFSCGVSTTRSPPTWEGRRGEMEEEEGGGGGEQ